MRRPDGRRLNAAPCGNSVLYGPNDNREDAPHFTEFFIQGYTLHFRI